MSFVVEVVRSSFNIGKGRQATKGTREPLATASEQLAHFSIAVDLVGRGFYITYEVVGRRRLHKYYSHSRKK